MKVQHYFLLGIGIIYLISGCGELMTPWELKAPEISIEDLQNSNKKAAEEVDVAGPMIDFRQPAKVVMPGVVHVISSYKNKKAPKRSFEAPDLFKDFFGDDFWFDFKTPDQRSLPQKGSGSGVIITDDGYIVTNNHVINHADEIEIILNNNKSYQAKVIGTDPATDLALLKIDATSLPFVRLGDSDQLAVGEWVLAVGNPFNLSTTVTAGIVSAKARNINIIQDQASIESFIQTDAAVNPGNSGGALVNLKGLLVGINTAIASPTGSYAGYSFAIPVNIVKKIVDDIINYGQVQRAYLGIFIRNMDSKLAENLQVNSVEGVYIDSLVPGGSAALAGLEPEEVILDIDGTEIISVPQLQEIIGTHRPGDEILITVLAQDGKKRSVPVILNDIRGANAPEKRTKDDLLEKLGVELEEYPGDGSESTVSVSNIYPGIIRKHTDMRPGFIIRKVGQVLITSINQFLDVVKSLEGGGVLLEGFYPDHPNETVYYAFGK